MYFLNVKIALVAAATASLTAAWPTAILDAAGHDPEVLKRAEQEVAKAMQARQGSASAATSVFEPIPIFDAKAQYIDVSAGSGHEYVPPGPGDLRGPCPGLNALANHNFLPHNGYATVTQYVEATTKVVGMGPTLALLLSAVGGSLSGDILNWSMGGKPSLAQAGLTGILGNGLTGSHNKYETDGSPTRGDLYQTGNNFKTVPAQFQQLVDASPGGFVTLESLTAFRSARVDAQRKSNPYYFSGPFAGVLVQPAAYTFIFRFMANHSAENPEGILPYDVLQSWFGIQGSSGKYTAVQGGERIPNNWYRRPIAYPYDTPYFLADTLNAAALYPKFLEVGGNTGQPDSFVGVDVSSLTGGIFSSANLLKGNNLACFVYQISALAKPDILLGVLTTLLDIVNNAVAALSCPQLKNFDQSVLKQFPGYSRQSVYG
ncbi:hypothetical protein COCCADRAFT_35376 [Bipolaris zeicola 26-R-13]|uniref:Heme haloperoxidase family profile domain-containing protein n=1 Tax=Cochliobolus carbonum (strain 26-R-13) TaxID=930089 RepID=W6YU33_COCC2|nr:uncharacterized protein COCCADRAFT_35376 [Bipolaris zeicola 26-R-13]EUC35031.1 hypothetical protein COCCADRAFT_35376 [Bipolaris zeicola 26-R-13]